MPAMHNFLSSKSPRKHVELYLHLGARPWRLTAIDGSWIRSVPPPLPPLPPRLDVQVEPVKEQRCGPCSVLQADDGLHSLLKLLETFNIAPLLCRHLHDCLVQCRGIRCPGDAELADHLHVDGVLIGVDDVHLLLDRIYECQNLHTAGGVTETNINATIGPTESPKDGVNRVREEKNGKNPDREKGHFFMLLRNQVDFVNEDDGRGSDQFPDLCHLFAASTNVVIWRECVRLYEVSSSSGRFRRIIQVELLPFLGISYILTVALMPDSWNPFNHNPTFSQQSVAIIQGLSNFNAGADLPSEPSVVAFESKVKLPYTLLRVASYHGMTMPRKMRELLDTVRMLHSTGQLFGLATNLIFSSLTYKQFQSHHSQDVELFQSQYSVN
ncbi:hypothetical protein B0H14DRAFT_2613380 [Mycena olivaceomarginata]|nr:hypothetical protein B0H14DRAFT_2613380 [Mycena olivaceomarginata]